MQRVVWRGRPQPLSLGMSGRASEAVGCVGDPVGQLLPGAVGAQLTVLEGTSAQSLIGLK